MASDAASGPLKKQALGSGSRTELSASPVTSSGPSRPAASPPPTEQPQPKPAAAQSTKAPAVAAGGTSAPASKPRPKAAADAGAPVPAIKVAALPVRSSRRDEEGDGEGEDCDEDGSIEGEDRDGDDDYSGANAPKRGLGGAASGAPSEPLSARPTTFVPATRHKPHGLSLQSFLPAYAPRGFGEFRTLPDALSSTFTRTGRRLAADDSAIRVLEEGHDDFCSAMSYRLEEYRTCADMWTAGSVSNAVGVLQVAAADDPIVGADFLRAFRLDSGALNLEAAALLVPIIGKLLKDDRSACLSVAFTAHRGIVAAFGDFLKSTLTAGTGSSVSGSGTDLAAEDRHRKCMALLQALEAVRPKLGQLLAQSALLASLDAEVVASLNQAQASYEQLRNALPLPVVAEVGRSNARF